MTPLEDISPAIPLIKDWLNGRRPNLAIVLGSGLSGVVDRLQGPIKLAYSELPDFPTTNVAGHSGALYSGDLCNRDVLIFAGRYHCYEGYTGWQVTALIRLAAALGCEQILLTNAAGGISEDLQPGDFMLVTDHLNLTGENPLRGRPQTDFLDVSKLYRHDFYPDLKAQLVVGDVGLQSGVLAWMLGPSYETPAEVRMLQTLGAAAVSMSTIPEALMARHLGLETVALSYISNLAAGKSPNCLDHQDVLVSGQRATTSLDLLLPALFSRWLD